MKISEDLVSHSKPLATYSILVFLMKVCVYGVANTTLPRWTGPGIIMTLFSKNLVIQKKLFEVNQNWPVWNTLFRLLLHPPSKNKHKFALMQ